MVTTSVPMQPFPLNAKKGYTPIYCGISFLLCKKKEDPCMEELPCIIQQVSKGLKKQGSAVLDI